MVVGSSRGRSSRRRSGPPLHGRERERERERETMGAEGVDNGGNDEEIRVGWVPLVSGWIRCV
jgi:hypothetical protein